MMKAVAIIQARMSSTRLPGKVLMKVKGRPLLWYQLERLRESKRISGIIIVTSSLFQDDEIDKFSKENRVDCFRGSYNDVLDRYYKCALAYGIKVVVRITADCPLIESRLVDDIIDFYLENPDFDLVRTGPTYPEGFDAEVFPFKSLEAAWKEARLKSEREHVTAFLWKNDKRFKVKTLSLEKDYSFLRFSIDEARDFEVVKVIIEELSGKKGTAFNFQDILHLYKEKPYIFEKNKDIVRNEGYKKSLNEDYIVER